MPGETPVFSAPLGMIQSGRLVFTAGAQDVGLRTCHCPGEQFQARFTDPLALLQTQEGMVIIQPASHLLRGIEIDLQSAIPWEIEFRGSVTNLHADLTGLCLRSIDILGDASQITFYLPRPKGAVFLYIAGGIRNAAIYRPAGVGNRVHTVGGIEECRFDQQVFHSIRAETHLESAAFAPEDGYYDLTISGSVKSLTVAEQPDR